MAGCQSPRRVGISMWRSWKTLGAGVALAAGALLPLYGDPRTSPVTHSEWARMVLRALDLLESGSGLDDQASQVFATLSGKGSRAFRADLYSKGTGVEAFTDADGTRHVRATSEVGQLVYPLAVARGGDYRMRLRLGGPAEAEADVTAFGKEAPVQSFRVLPASMPAWLDAGSAHLDPGAYNATVLMPRGSVLEFVEFAPPCLSPIEPRGGWRASAVATTDDVALTVLQAIDLESELPPAAQPLEWRGSDMRVEEPTVSTAAMAAGQGLEEGTLRASTRGLKAVLVADLPEAGFYTLSVFGLTPGGASWVGDSCRKSVLCPVQDEIARWRVILSGDFAAGPHSFTVTLGAGSTVGRLRLERKKDAAEHYVATVRRLGLDLGSGGPITRARAIDARKFIQERHSLASLKVCGDVVLPGTLVASAGPGGPGVPGRGSRCASGRPALQSGRAAARPAAGSREPGPSVAATSRPRRSSPLPRAGSRGPGRRARRRASGTCPPRE